MSATTADTVLSRLAALDTPVLSDALDHLGLAGAALGLQPLWPAPRVLVGRARTVEAGPKTEDGPVRHIATSVVASAARDDVIVIANGGRTDASCWGGILAAGAALRGVAGVVIDGACRDIADCEALHLPVFGRAVVPVSARTRIAERAVDIQVRVAGVVVTPGDLVVGDRCGVVCVPAARAVEVVEVAEALMRRESAMVAAVRAGRPITAVMHDSQFDVSTTEVP